MSNTINTAYNAQVLVGQNGNDTTSTSATATQSENDTSTASSSIPKDTLTISDEAKSLANASQNNAGGIGGMSGSSSGDDTEDLITKLKEKIAQLEKEIAKEKNSSKGDQNNQTIKIKEALLTSYQAQLAALLSQASQ